ncbi:hypothetical protein MRX96_039274 [Rhipicephalus microplus]
MLALGGGAADHLVPCTASEKQTCQIVTKLVTWNRLLRGSGLEIQEQPETSDQLHIMNFPFSSTWGSIKLRKLPNQAELLEWLLSTHKCIGSVSLDLSLGHDTSTRVLRAISEKKGVKTMKLSSMEASAARTISATLPCLTEIVTLHLTCFPCLLDGFIDPPVQVAASVIVSQWLCAELKCSGCERKVSLGHHQFTGQIDLIDCEAFSGTDLLVNVTDGDKLAILHRLPSYEHIKYISIWIYSDYMHQSLALAEYLRSTRTLHALKLSVIGAVLGRSRCPTTMVDDHSGVTI